MEKPQKGGKKELRKCMSAHSRPTARPSRGANRSMKKKKITIYIKMTIGHNRGDVRVCAFWTWSSPESRSSSNDQHECCVCTDMCVDMHRHASTRVEPKAPEGLQSVDWPIRRHRRFRPDQRLSNNGDRLWCRQCLAPLSLGWMTRTGAWPAAAEWGCTLS